MTESNTKKSLKKNGDRPKTLGYQFNYALILAVVSLALSVLALGSFYFIFFVQIKDLKSDYSIALVSDAGMPLICDPGEELVRICKQHHIDIIPIPGPCAAIAALVSSGFPSSRFVFEGFLPKKKIERQKILKEISKCEKTTILFESPHRLRKLLNELLDFCGEEREIEISRELTKKYEEHIGLTMMHAIDSFKEREPKGEFTVVIKGFKKSNNSKFNTSFLNEELHALVDAGLTLSSASKYLAKKNNLKKNEIYDLY